MNSSSVTAPRPAEADTASRILSVAEELVQTRGFNDVSYADIAARLGITKPSLHYHFASKAVLGEAMIRRYGARFFAECDLIDTEESDARAKLARYADLYRTTVAAGRMCLCGILAAEYGTLPDAMRVAVLEFFDRNENWLSDVLALRAADPAEDPERRRETARTIIDTLQGAVMLARAYGDTARFDAAARQLLARV